MGKENKKQAGLSRATLKIKLKTYLRSSNNSYIAAIVQMFKISYITLKIYKDYVSK